MWGIPLGPHYACLSWILQNRASIVTSPTPTPSQPPSSCFCSVPFLCSLLPVYWTGSLYTPPPSSDLSLEPKPYFLLPVAVSMSMSDPPAPHLSCTQHLVSPNLPASSPVITAPPLPSCLTVLVDTSCFLKAPLYHNSCPSDGFQDSSLTPLPPNSSGNTEHKIHALG